MSNDKYRFEEIKEQIKELLEEAISLVPDAERNRAESYWFAEISIALDEYHDYLGGSMCSMQDTIDEWNDGDDDEEEEDYIDLVIEEGEDYDHAAGRPAHMRDEDWD